MIPIKQKKQQIGRSNMQKTIRMLINLQDLIQHMDKRDGSKPKTKYETVSFYIPFHNKNHPN